MNRAERRAAGQRLVRFRDRCAELGVTWGVTGLRDACADCSATGDVEVLPDGRLRAHIWHSETCPWYRANVGAS